MERVKNAETENMDVCVIPKAVQCWYSALIILLQCTAASRCIMLRAQTASLNLRKLIIMLMYVPRHKDLSTA